VKPAAVEEEFSQLVRYNEETKRKASLRRPHEAELQEADTFLEWSGQEANGKVPAARRWKCLRTARDLFRPSTLRPLCLVIPFFFFVHWSGMTAIRPYMVHVFQGFRVPIDPKWATVSSNLLHGCLRLEVLEAVNIKTFRPGTLGRAFPFLLLNVFFFPFSFSYVSTQLIE
jgi:hypothetical protein